MEKAVAIKYDESLPAPFILAKGKGELAKVITAIARKHGIDVLPMIELTEGLIEMDVGALIPEQYYEIVAELLVFVKGLAEDEKD